MDEIKHGVWQWTAPHPEWRTGNDWGRVVSSFAIDDGARLLVFDPLEAPEQLSSLAAQRETAVVLTCPWHARDAVGLAARLDAPLYVPPPDAADPDPLDGIVYRAGETLPVGLEAHAGAEPNDLVLWSPATRLLVVGDTVIERDGSLVFPADWATRNGYDPDVVRADLQPLRDLPFDGVLATHGGHFDRAALEAALGTHPRSMGRGNAT